LPESRGVGIGKLIIVGILVAAALIAFMVLTQRGQPPSLQDVVKGNPDHYAEYTITAEMGGAVRNASLYYAKKGQREAMGAKSEQGETKLVINGGTAYYCHAPPGGQWKCGAISVEEARKYRLKEFLANIRNVTPLSPKTIAGQYSYCWGGVIPTKTPAVSIKAAFCLTPSGVLTRLVTQTSVQGRVLQRMEINLDKISWEVPDSVFELPAKP